MQKMLKHKLHDYIKENNPDVLLTLEVENSVTKYVFDKVNSLNLWLRSWKKKINLHISLKKYA